MTSKYDRISMWIHPRAYEIQKEFWWGGNKTGAWFCQHPIAACWDDEQVKKLNKLKERGILR